MEKLDHTRYKYYMDGFVIHSIYKGMQNKYVVEIKLENGQDTTFVYESDDFKRLYKKVPRYQFRTDIPLATLVKQRGNNTQWVIHCANGCNYGLVQTNSWANVVPARITNPHELLENYTFMDGSPCGNLVD